MDIFLFPKKERNVIKRMTLQLMNRPGKPKPLILVSVNRILFLYGHKKVYINPEEQNSGRRGEKCKTRLN